jgi:hypothetical protein
MYTIRYLEKQRTVQNIAYCRLPIADLRFKIAKGKWQTTKVKDLIGNRQSAIGNWQLAMIYVLPD